MKICPHCRGKAHKSHAHGFLGRVVLRRVGLRAYHCRECSSFFYRFPGDEARLESEKPSAFRPAASRNGDFQKLIGEIREAEIKADLEKCTPPPSGLGDLDDFRDRQESLFPASARKAASVEDLKPQIVSELGQVVTAALKQGLTQRRKRAKKSKSSIPRDDAKARGRRRHLQNPPFLTIHTL